MEEIFGITVALRYLDFGKHVAVITDARFSGVSTGACIGHITPEALAGGPIGKVREGDLIEVIIDREKLEGSVNLAAGDAELAARPLRDDLASDPDLPPETRLWAALQNASGGTWAGCVFDVEKITRAIAQPSD
jgi:dihydroxyacid dehydratase/phosphogluconate dehydratase